jgi:hypothetical protein
MTQPSEMVCILWFRFSSLFKILNCLAYFALIQSLLTLLSKLFGIGGIEARGKDNQYY